LQPWQLASWQSWRVEGPKLSSEQTEPDNQDGISEQANPKTTMAIVHDNEKKKKKRRVRKTKVQIPTVN
jgi:hypothetical protein